MSGGPSCCSNQPQMTGRACQFFEDLLEGRAFRPIGTWLVAYSAMTQRRSELIELIFQQASDLPEPDRAQFLNDRCRGDQPLRAEVETLLAHGESADAAFLCGPRRDDSQSTDTNHPRRIGSYSIIRKVGEGGMGLVYEAQQEHPRRHVALKLIRSPLASERLLRRFRHEADVLGHLAHPGIACIYEAGVGDVMYGDEARPTGQAPYFAMEYVPGLPLTDFASRAAMTVRERLDLFAEICEAVHYAHERGVIHRDLKPANILVVGEVGPLSRNSENTTTPRIGHPKILDFGIARFTAPDIQTLTLQTDAGQLVGTVPYMCPEQVMGAPKSVDARSDVYALGVILFELLAGRLPHDFAGRPLPEALRIIREDEPSHLGSIDPVFRGDIETIVARALEKEPSRRYPSAAALAGDIRRYLADEPIVARKASAVYQLRKFARRNRRVVLAMGFAFLSLLGGLIGMTVLAMRVTQERDSVRSRSEELRRAARRANLTAAVAALSKPDMPAAMRALNDVPEDLRTFEWRHLRFRADPSILHFDVAPAATGVHTTLSSDGAVVYSIGSDLVLRRWNARDGSPVGELGRCPASIVDFRITPDGARCMLSHENGLLEMRETPSMRVIWSIADRGSRWPATLFPDGRFVAASAKENRSVMIIDAEDGRIIDTLNTSSELPPPIISGDGQWMACTGDELSLVDLSKRQVIWRKFLLKWQFAAFSPDAQRIAITRQAGATGELGLLDVATGELLTSRPLDWNGYLGRVAWRPDGATLAIGTSTSGAVEVAESATLRRLALLPVAPPIDWLRYSKDGKQLVAGAPSGWITAWPAQPPLAPFTAGTLQPVFAADISSDGALAATVGWGLVSLIDLHTGELLWARNISIAQLRAVSISPDAKRIAVDAGMGSIAVLRADTGDLLIASPRKRNLELTALVWKPDSASLLAGFDNGTIVEVSADAPAKPLREFQYAWGRVHFLAISPDGRTLAAIADEADRIAQASAAPGDKPQRSLVVFDVEESRPRWCVDANDGSAICAVFGHDGVMLATGGADGQVHLWNAKDGSRIASLTGVTSEVRTIAFSMNGDRLAAAAQNGRIHLWEIATGTEVSVLAAGAGASLAFRPDETALIAVDVGMGGTTIMETTHSSATMLSRRDLVAQAMGLIDPLVRDPKSPEARLCANMIAEIEKMPHVNQDVRREAVDLLKRRGDHAAHCNGIAWGLVANAQDSREKWEVGLQMAEAAASALPDHAGILNTLGVAQFRLGRLSDARATFDRCVEMATREWGVPTPSDLLFLAMTEHRLGHVGEARKQLEKAKHYLGDLDGGVSQEDQRFLKEAEALLNNGGS